MNTRVIVISEDRTFARGLKYSLEQDGYAVANAYSIREAMHKTNNRDFDLFILGLSFPDGDGLELCQKIRDKSQVPIIILTEKNEDISQILALEYGADDYIIRPVNILVLKAKIKALLRRINMKNYEIDDHRISTDDFTINALGRKLIIGDKSIHLTGKEFDLLYILASNPGKVFTREELLETIWGYEYFGDLRTVDVHIRRLREKIEEECDAQEYIRTKWGIGYYFQN